MTPCLTLSLIRYGSRVRSNPGKDLPPSLHVIVVAIEKEAFVSVSTTVGQLNNSYPLIH